VTEIAAIGHLSRDVVAGGEPRPGGTIFYSARALARLGADAVAAASCAATDREALLRPLEAFGIPVSWHESSATTEYRFRYEGDRRLMFQDAVGDPWSPEQARAGAGDATWVHVGALARTDFPPDTLAALAEGGRALLVDGQGLVRTSALGPLRIDGEVESGLSHVTVLKLDGEEAEALAGGTEPKRLLALGVPELILTLGSRGALVVTPSLTEHVPALELDLDVDPTGAGDTFSAAYLVARSRGAEPVEAARTATGTVAEFLAGG
jgi:sugar/nucleoside kinase (ribokinase family)